MSKITVSQHALGHDDLLAPYAMHAADTAGRVHAEPGHAYRNPYQRDRDRIVHSSAFRRLAHKTQVFTGDMGDYHRSRLTHTLEVASIARTVGRTLRLNEDLIEALALMHDIGHPPFGHAGEEVLDRRLADHGGFNHNQQALRIVELLETRYPDFPGLNLSRELLEGQAGRVRRQSASPGDWTGRLLEAQVVDAADNIAYDAHDADDAVELGLLTLGDLDESALWRLAVHRVRQRYAALDEPQFRRAAVHELIDVLVSDLVASSQQRLAEAAPPDIAAIQAYSEPLVAPSPPVAAPQRELERLLFDRVYRHPSLLTQRAEAAQALGVLFDRQLDDPQRLPTRFAPIAAREGLSRAAADYLSEMTDRLALEEFDRVTNVGG
jgi:dGTPase